MIRFGRIATMMVFGLLGLMLFSCNDSSSIGETPHDQRGSYTLTAFVDDGDGQFHKMEFSSTSLRALERGPVNIGSAVITGLGDYFHNETCEIGINPKPNSGMKVKLVKFEYQAAYDPKTLPTSVLEYNNRTKPSNNPKGYEVNFVFPVIGDVKVLITMEDKDDGVDVVIDGGSNGGSRNEGGKVENPGINLGIDK